MTSEEVQFNLIVMKVLQIKNIDKKDIPLHYRNEYFGSALIELNSSTQLEKKITFTIERGATGMVDISVEFLEEIDYPLLPIMKTLKDYIGELDKKGELP